MHRAGKGGKCYCLLVPAEIPYMFDISTHIGRKLINETEEGKTGELCNPEVGYYGVFPTNLVAEECQEVSENHKRVDG